MNVFVYPAQDENVEKELKERYIKEILALEGKDETFKKQLSEGKINITVTPSWRFFCIAKLNKLDVTVTYTVMYIDKQGSIREVPGKTATLDNGLVLHEEGYHINDTTHNLVSYIPTKKINLCSEDDCFTMELGTNPYTGIRGREIANAILQACEKREKGTIPNYVDRSVAKRARTLDISKRTDLIKERALEKCKNIRGFLKSSFEFQGVNDYDFESCDVYLYPLYDIVVNYQDRIYGVHGVSPLDKKLVIASATVAPDGDDYKKVKKVYNVARKLVFTQILLTAGITAVVFFLMLFGKIPLPEEYLGWILFAKVLPLDIISYRIAGLHDYPNHNIKSLNKYLFRLRFFGVAYLIISISVIAFVLLKAYGVFFV